MEHQHSPRDASDATSGDAGTGSRRRRDGRGWGPFSGGQLTAIIITLAIVIGFPVAAFAVTGSNSFITDFTSGVHAKVDAKQNVNTATHDAVSGVAAKVNSLGQLSVAATGAVTATQTPPNNSYNSAGVFAFESSACTSVTPTVPAGKALVVTSITVNIFAVTTGPVRVSVGSANPTSVCSYLTHADVIHISGAKVSQLVPIPSGFPVKPGHVIGVSMTSTSGDAEAFVLVHGYLVSSTLCTVTGPPTGCN